MSHTTDAFLKFDISCSPRKKTGIDSSTRKSFSPKVICYKAEYSSNLALQHEANTLAYAGSQSPCMSQDIAVSSLKIWPIIANTHDGDQSEMA